MDAKKVSNGNNKNDKQKNKTSAPQKPPAPNIAKLQNQKPIDTKYKTTTLFKNIFDTPFRVTWPAIPKQDWDEVAQLLASMLRDTQIRVPHVNRGPKGSKKRKADGQEPVDNTTASDAAEKIPEPPKKRQMTKSEENTDNVGLQSHAVKKPEPTESDLLLVGLNEVTKQIERDNVQIVVVAKQLEPSRIVQHLPVLCSLRRVPLLAAPVNNIDLGQFFQLQSVICFAIKKTDKATKFDDFIRLASEKAISINIPWMSDQIRAIAAQNLKQFSRAASAAAASAASSEDPSEIKVDESLKLEHKTLQPLHMKRAETQKQIPLNQKGKQQQKKKQQQKEAPADDDAMQE